MSIRVALANVEYPATPAASVAAAERAIAAAAAAGADIVCFPECFVPGYRAPGRDMARPDESFLTAAWTSVAAAAARHRVAVVLGTERVDGEKLLASALVIDRGGAMLGFQDKVQIDPAEDGLYSPGEGRSVFSSDGVTFGIVICHVGCRYPEPVRWAVRQGATLVFHQQFMWHEPGGYVPRTFGDPANTFHEASIRCRAAENTCFVASVNYALPDAPTTSAIVAPDGSVVCYQPYGVAGLLVADLDLDRATRLLATRLRPRADSGSVRLKPDTTCT
jgi:predicted amidohydrolase